MTDLGAFHKLHIVPWFCKISANTLDFFDKHLQKNELHFYYVL